MFINKNIIENNNLRISLLAVIVFIFGYIQNYNLKSSIAKFRGKKIKNLKKTLDIKLNKIKDAKDKMKYLLELKDKNHELRNKKFEKWRKELNDMFINNCIILFVIFFIIPKFFHIESSIISKIIYAFIYLFGTFLTSSMLFVSGKWPMMVVNFILIFISFIIDVLLY